MSHSQRLNGIPLWINNKEFYVANWSEKMRSYLSINEQKPEYIEHLQTIKGLLSELHINENSSRFKFSPTQSFFSYEDLVFRDWCWNSEDLNYYTEYLKEKVSGDVLFLGAGACGLAYNIATKIQNKVMAMDLNPFLIACAHSILNGKDIQLYEFPNRPKDLSVIKWNIKSQIKPENLHIGIGDFYEMPFENKSFNTIIACWFYDILDDSLEDLIAHTQHYLADDGKIIYMAPANFKSKASLLHKNPREVIDAFKHMGMKVDHQIKSLPYLKSPNSSAYRMEDVLLITATLTKRNAKLIENKSFELDLDQSIPLIPEITQEFNRHDVMSRVLKFVDGSNSIRDIAKKLENEFGFEPNEALNYSNGFFHKLIWDIKSRQ